MSITFRGPDNFSVPINYVGLYSDGVPMVKTEGFDLICRMADTMVLKARDLNEFIVAMFLVDGMWKHQYENKTGNYIENLVMPYIPGARQDRVNVDGDVLFTASSVANMVVDRFSKCVVLDPHSPVVLKYLEYSNNPAHKITYSYPLERVAAKMWQGYTGIIAADKGGQDRAEQFADAMGKPIFYGSKVRDVTNGKLTGFAVDDLPKGGHFLVVDDICDGGGTFIGLAQKIRDQGCYADLFVSHGIFSKGTAELKRYYKNIYTTDSREQVRDLDVLTINVVEDMVEYARTKMPQL